MYTYNLSENLIEEFNIENVTIMRSYTFFCPACQALLDVYKLKGSRVLTSHNSCLNIICVQLKAFTLCVLQYATNLECQNTKLLDKLPEEGRNDFKVTGNVSLFEWFLQYLISKTEISKAHEK